MAARTASLPPRFANDIEASDADSERQLRSKQETIAGRERGGSPAVRPGGNESRPVQSQTAAFAGLGRDAGADFTALNRIAYAAQPSRFRLRSTSS